MRISFTESVAVDATADTRTLAIIPTIIVVPVTGERGTEKTADA